MRKYTVLDASKNVLAEGVCFASGKCVTAFLGPLKTVEVFDTAHTVLGNKVIEWEEFRHE